MVYWTFRHQLTALGALCVQDQQEDQGTLKTVDPMLMEQYHLTEKDEEVREVDCPERLFVEMHKIPSFELQGLADYIYSSLFGPDAPEQLIKVRICLLAFFCR